MKLKIYDTVCSDDFTRIVYGKLLDEAHKCDLHQESQIVPVYYLSGTTSKHYKPSEDLGVSFWCDHQMQNNHYIKCTHEKGTHYD